MPLSRRRTSQSKKNGCTRRRPAGMILRSRLMKLNSRIEMMRLYILQSLGQQILKMPSGLLYFSGAIGKS